MPSVLPKLMVSTCQPDFWSRPDLPMVQYLSCVLPPIPQKVSRYHCCNTIHHLTLPQCSTCNTVWLELRFIQRLLHRRRPLFGVFDKVHTTRWIITGIIYIISILICCTDKRRCLYFTGFSGLHGIAHAMCLHIPYAQISHAISHCAHICRVIDDRHRTGTIDCFCPRKHSICCHFTAIETADLPGIGCRIDCMLCLPHIEDHFVSFLFV